MQKCQEKCKLLLFDTHSSGCSSGLESHGAQATTKRCFSPKEPQFSNKYVSSKTIKHYRSYRPEDMCTQRHSCYQKKKKRVE